MPCKARKPGSQTLYSLGLLSTPHSQHAMQSAVFDQSSGFPRCAKWRFLRLELPDARRDLLSSPRLSRLMLSNTGCFSLPLTYGRSQVKNVLAVVAVECVNGQN